MSVDYSAPGILLRFRSAEYLAQCLAERVLIATLNLDAVAERDYYLMVAREKAKTFDPNFSVVRAVSTRVRIFSPMNQKHAVY